MAEMAINTIHIIYFSATGTTLKTAKAIAEGGRVPNVKMHDMTRGADTELHIPKNEAVLFAAPVYAGRIPAIMADALTKVRGEGTPAVVVCVYGNRDYDDALLELKSIAERQGFLPVSAAAFIAQHSIFPELAAGRPDSVDIQDIREFGRMGLKLAADVHNVCLHQFHVPGNYPYKEAKAIPLIPRTHGCDKCGACAKECPAHAIDPENPSHTDAAKCISCAHCIHICPKHARHWGGLKYMIASRKFVRLFSDRKEPFILYRR